MCALLDYCAPATGFFVMEWNACWVDGWVRTFFFFFCSFGVVQRTVCVYYGLQLNGDEMADCVCVCVCEMRKYEFH